MHPMNEHYIKLKKYLIVYCISISNNIININKF